MNKISTKTRLNIIIDTEIYLKIKMSQENINMSQLINDFLKEHFKSDHTKEEEIKEELKSINKKRILLEYELEIKSKEKEKEQQKKLTLEEEEEQKLISSVPRGKSFYDKLQREKILKAHPEIRKYFGEDNEK